MRLIYADKLYDRIVNAPSVAANKVIKLPGHTQLLTAMADRQNEILDMISNTPTIDPVHAAGGCYCRECKSWKNVGAGHSHWTCVNPNGLDDPRESDFCSYGKRKEWVE